MAIRNVLTRGEAILKKNCKPVKEINERIEILVEDMIDTMVEHDGVGLAAPQIGVMKRLFVCKPYRDEEEDEGEETVFVMINPEFIETSGEQSCIEGCLSVPGYYGYVNRPEYVKMRAQDLDGKMHEYEFTGFAANVVSHENDHLNGILYTEKADKMLTIEEYERILEKKESQKKQEE